MKLPSFFFATLLLLAFVSCSTAPASSTALISLPSCVKSAAPFRPFFEEMAANGYLMIACGPLTMRAPEAPAADAPRPVMVQNTKEDMIAAIDWAFAENERKDSPFFGKIDTRHVSVMGQSCGGILCLDICTIIKCNK